MGAKGASMSEKGKICYSLSSIEKAVEFEKAVLQIKGVVGATVDKEKKTFCYEIDEWTSDYDVFTEIMNMVDEYGVQFDFSSSDEKREQISEFEIHGDEEMGEEFLQNGLELSTEQEEEQSEVKPKKKGLNEKVERLIEIGSSLVFFGLSFVFDGVANFIFLALAFALAGYDILYEAFLKIVKKDIFSEELVISIALFCAIFLGYSTHTVGACLIWTVSNFTVKHLCDCVKSGKVAYYKPEKLKVINSNDEQIEVAFEEVGIGDKVKYNAGEVCVLDGAVLEECEVCLASGKTVTLNEGDKILAGDKLLEDACVMVLCAEEQNENHAFNQKAMLALEQKSDIESKLNRVKKVALPVLFAVCLLIAFIPPIFAQTYMTGLYRWGYTAIIILSTCSFGLFNGSLIINIYSGLKVGRLNGTFLGGYHDVQKIAGASSVAFDGEKGAFENDGRVKQNLKGAIRELKDCDLKTFSLITSADEHFAEEVCRDCKIHEFYAGRNQEQKNEILLEKLSEGGIAVASLPASEGDGAVVSLNAKKEGYLGNACIIDGEIKSLPYIVKLAKRTQKIKKANLVLTIIAKAVIALLALLGVAGLWWAMLIDVAMGMIAVLNGIRNAGEII